MSLETIYYISQIIAVLAVIASMIFVGIQIRQSTKQAEESERVARGEVLQNIAEGLRQHSLVMMAYPEVYECFVNHTDPADISEADRLRVATFCFATIHVIHNIDFQHQKGLLDDQTYQSYVPFLVSLLRTPVGQHYWTARRGMFDTNFAVMMDQRFSQADPLAPAVQGDEALASEGDGVAS